ncbi:hypothetical protein [Stenotrophomonas sp. TD3]|uniref:hypothetical protein n=1 Tax=Stenotrophomonas sp. TD3 TaxID=1641707 RepID=UPI000AE3E044|nr:hypothetical protein [Stenotrophomonas sp. TD3]
MEKQKPGFGRAFVVLGLWISWLPASGRHYPWFRVSEGVGSEPFPLEKDPTPDLSLEESPLDVQGGAPTGAGIRWNA